MNREYKVTTTITRKCSWVVWARNAKEARAFTNQRQRPSVNENKGEKMTIEVRLRKP